jgi:hypothetical protein
MSGFLSNDACMGMDIMATGIGHFQAAQGLQMPLDMSPVSVFCRVLASWLGLPLRGDGQLLAAFTAYPQQRGSVSVRRSSPAQPPTTTMEQQSYSSA